jgi:anti-anti-sigma factor
MDVPPLNSAGRRLRSQVPSVRFETLGTGLLRAKVRGELDATAARELYRRLQEELMYRQPDRVVIELAAVRFLGLHGIAVLERLRRQTTGYREVVLGSVSPAAERALRLAGVLRRFERAAPGWTEGPL